MADDSSITVKQTNKQKNKQGVKVPSAPSGHNEEYIKHTGKN